MGQNVSWFSSTDFKVVVLILHHMKVWPCHFQRWDSNSLFQISILWINIARKEQVLDISQVLSLSFPKKKFFKHDLFLQNLTAKSSICWAFRSSLFTAVQHYKVNILHPFPVALGSGQTTAFLNWWIGSFLFCLSPDKVFMRLSRDRLESLWIKQNPS